MNWRNEIYEKITERLRERVPGLAYIDMQKGQFPTSLQESYPVPRPCGLVEIDKMDFIDYQKKVQRGNGKLAIYIFVDAKVDSDEERENKTPKIYSLLDKVYEALNGFSGENFAKLKRIAETPVSHKGNLSAYKIEFNLDIFDDKRTETQKAQVSEFKIQQIN